MPRSAGSIPVDGGSSWTIETNPSGAIGSEHRSPVRILCAARGRVRLTGAGYVAVQAVIQGYYTPGKIASLIGLGAGDVTSHASLSDLYLDVLPADIAAVAASLTAVFNVASNVAV